MSKFYQLPSGGWAHEDYAVGTFYAPKKPPEWMSPCLRRLYDAAYSHGKREVQSNIREALDFLIPEPPE